jgi:flagellar motor protein MotB
MSRMEARIAVVPLALGVVGLAGCGALPSTRLAECHQRSQVLQSQMVQLKDETTQLRGKNRELTDRAIDDARRIGALKESNQQLERSVLVYQDERDRLVEAFETLQKQIRSAAVDGPRQASVSPPVSIPYPGGPGANPDRLAAFALAHPGCQWDADRGIWSVPADKLFEPGSDTLRPGTELLIAAFGRLLADRDPDGLPAAVAAPSISVAGDPDLKRTTAGDELNQAPPRASLAARRARAVRDPLARALGVKPDEIDATSPPARPDYPGEELAIQVRFQPDLPSASTPPIASANDTSP